MRVFTPTETDTNPFSLSPISSQSPINPEKNFKKTKKSQKNKKNTKKIFHKKTPFMFKQVTYKPTHSGLSTAATHRTSTDTEASTHIPEVTTITNTANDPLVGTRCERICYINNIKVPVLFDTGSPTSLVSEDLVVKHGWNSYNVPPFVWKGAIAGRTSTATKALHCKLIDNNVSYDFKAYITPELHNQVIVGNPIIEHYPDLLSNINTTTNSNTTTNITIGAIDQIFDTDVQEIFLIQPSKNENSIKPQRHELPLELQQEFKDTVTDTLPPKSGTHTYNHMIELKPDSHPPRLPPYRMTPLLEKECKKIIEELLNKGFIVESKSPVSSPVLLVKKKDGSYRLVVDFRQLNDLTIKDPYPLPRIDDLMAKIGDCSIFSTLDLHSGYHQIPLAAESEELTGFTTPFGHYHYKVMPFGLCNAPATFSRYMQRILGNIPHVFVYLDDILIASKDYESHIHDLRQVLKRLQQEGLVCKKSKCYFSQSEVQFLGHTLSAAGFAVQEDKVKAIKDLPMPTTIKSAQSFMGMVNYYRNFIPQCSKLAKPLFDFISKKCAWSKIQEDAVIKLKNCLITAPILVPFVPGDNYRLTTDASYAAIGGVLERLTPSGKLLGVIGYFSKTISDTQSRYHIGELELLAIVESLKHFRYYLHGHKFLLRTDHSSLLSYRSKKEPSQRLTRWLQFLEEFEFEIEHIQGKNNAVADALSRPQEVSAIAICPLTTLSSVNPQDWYESLLEDPWSAAVLISLGAVDKINVSAADNSLYKKYLKRMKFSSKAQQRYQFDNNILYYDSRVCVPSKERFTLLQLYHDSFLQGGHFGETATINKLLPHYYWPSMSKEIKNFVQGCLQCQLMKRYRPKPNGALRPLDVPFGRWLDISIDFVTGIPTSRQGNDMIMVVVDRFSKRAHFIAMKKTYGSTGIVRSLFRYVFCYHGFPQTIVSDRDIRFASGYYKELTERLHIKLLKSTTNHPQTDGQTESVNKTLNRLLRTFCHNDHAVWDLFLPHLEFVYNSTPQSAVGAAPFEIDIGFIPNEPLMDTGNESSARNDTAVELTKKLEAITLRTRDYLMERQEMMETQENPHRLPDNFKVGEFVLLDRDVYFRGGRYLKIQPIFLGPFQIVKVLGNNTVELDLPSSFKKNRIINIKHIKKFVNDARRYPKKLPATAKERILRLPEIIAVTGYDVESQIYYCKMQDVNPELICEYSLEEFNQLPTDRRNSLLSNFRNLAEPLGEEDVVQ